MSVDPKGLEAAFSLVEGITIRQPTGVLERAIRAYVAATSPAGDLAQTVLDRIGQDFDGEAHFTEAEARQIAQALRYQSTGVTEPKSAEITDETAILRRLADGDAIVYSQDGDDCWFSKGDRAHIAEKAVLSLRDKGYIERRVDEDDDTDNYRGMAEYDTISSAGRAALSAQERG